MTDNLSIGYGMTYKLSVKIMNKIILRQLIFPVVLYYPGLQSLLIKQLFN